MTVVDFPSSPSLASTSDAEWRIFLSNYRAALSGAGFVRTSDTGQIDPTTVLRPATNTMSGYDIWRFNDAAQATHPIFFKVEYGMATAFGRMSFYVTVGTGSDGAGNITGIRIPRTNFTTQTGSVIGSVWVAGGEGYLTSGLFIHASNPSGPAVMWMIERVRLPNGAVDTSSLGAGIVFGYPNGWYGASYDNVLTDIGPTWPTLSPSSPTGTFAFRGVTNAYPYYPILGTVRSPSRAAIAVNPLDSGYALPFTVSLYGTPHIFRATLSGSSNFGRGSYSTPAFRYE